MDVIARGVRLYVLVLAFVATLAIVWGTNEFVLGNTSAGTGWPLTIGLAGLLLLLGFLVHLRRPGDGDPSTADPYPWSNNDR